MSTQHAESAKAWKIISSLGKEFKHHRSDQEILTFIAQKVYELTSVPRIYAIFSHRLNKSLELVLSMENGAVQELDDTESVLNRIGKSHIEQVIETQTPIFLHQQDLISYQESADGCASWLGVPMSAVDRAIGALVIQHPTLPNAFSEEVGQFLDVITDLAANAIDYYRLHERIKLIAELESGFTEIEATDERELLEKIYDKIQWLRDIDILTLSIVLQDKYKRKLKVVIANGQTCNTEDAGEQGKLLQTLNSKRIETIITSREPLLLCEGDITERQIEEMDDTELAWWVGVPMRIHGRAIGVFVVEHPENLYVYNKNDAEFLDILSDQAANAIERVRLEQRSRSLADIEKELLDVTQDNFTKDTILEIVARRAREVSDVYNLCIFLYDEREDNFKLEFAYRKDQQVDLSNKDQCQEILSYAPDCLLHQALNKPTRLGNRTKIIEAFDCENQERYPASWLGVPMRGARQNIGVFVIYHMQSENIYDREDERILDELSDQVALALGNAELREIEQKNFEQRIQDMELIGNIYEAVNQEHLEDVLERILETSVSFTQADYAEIWFCDFERSEIQLKMAYKDRRNDQFRKNTYSINKGLSGLAISSKQPCYRTNVKDDPDYIEISPDIHSELVIPLVFHSKTIGTMNLESKHIDAFSEEKQKLAKTLGDSAAVAIETSRLTQDLKNSTQDLKNSNAQLELYLSLLEELIVTEASFDEELLAEYIHDRASELMDTGNMYLALYNPDNDMVEFKIVYIRGERQDPYEPRKLSEGRGKTEEIIRTCKPLRHTSEQSRQWYQNQGRDYTNRDDDLPWLGVPILLGHDEQKRCLLGVIATYSADRTYVYTEQEQEVLEKMGRWAAIALENAKATKRVAEQENVLTRSLIAQDLIHRLSNIAGTIPVWLQLLEREINNFKDVNVESAKKYIAYSFDELKSLFREINQLNDPESKTQIDLRKVLQSLIESLKTLYKQDIDTRKLAIEDTLAEDLYDVFGFPSLLANSLDAVLKNGVDAVLAKGEGCVRVVAENTQQNTAQIIITDTGIGIPDDQKTDIFTPFFTTKTSGIGYGLWRAKTVFEKMGGRISFESQPDGPTTFIIVLPQGK